MVDAVQTPLLGLYAEQPNVDIVGALSKGQQFAQQSQQTQLGAMDLQQKQGEFSALQDYRNRMSSGDPNADQALQAYPELHSKFDEIANQITDTKLKSQSYQKASDLGEAARTLSGYPQGSPERQQAGEKAVDDLVSKGDLTQEQGDQAKKTGFTDLFLNQYLSLGDWAQRQLGPSDPKTRMEMQKAAAETNKYGAQADLARARVKQIENGTDGGNVTKALDPGRVRQGIENSLAKYRTYLTTLYPGGTDDDRYQIEQGVEVERQNRYKQEGLNPDGSEPKKSSKDTGSSAPQPKEGNAAAESPVAPAAPGSGAPVDNAEEPTPKKGRAVQSAQKSQQGQTPAAQGSGQPEFRTDPASGKTYMKAPDGKVYEVPGQQSAYTAPQGGAQAQPQPGQ